MSTRIMALCWPLKMRPPAKSVLVALADMANDEGFCWPSIDRLCERTCYGRTAVIEAIGWLEAAGAVRPNRTNGRKTTYWVTPEKFAAQAAGEPSSEPSNQSATRTGPPREPVRQPDRTHPPRGPVPVRHADTNRHLTVKEPKQPPSPPAEAGGAPARRDADDQQAAQQAGACDGFDAVMAAYPRRKAEVRARRAWDRLRPDSALQARILAAVRAQAASVEWRQLLVDGRDHLIPMLSTWLRGERWRDEVPVVVVQATPGKAWDATADGIVAMGVQLGLAPWDRAAFEAGRGEQFPVYEARVRRKLREQQQEVCDAH